MSFFFDRKGMCSKIDWNIYDSVNSTKKMCVWIFLNYTSVSDINTLKPEDRIEKCEIRLNKRLLTNLPSIVLVHRHVGVFKYWILIEDEIICFVTKIVLYHGKSKM